MAYWYIPQNFSEWRQAAFYSLNDCVMVFKVTKRTVRNWESGKVEAPFSVLICLQLFSRRLDFLGKSWRGFRITPECIESPDGDFVRANEIRALKYAMKAIDINRNRRCEMNKNKDGVIEPLDVNNKPYNVILIDGNKIKKAVPKAVPVTCYKSNDMQVDDINNKIA